MRGLAAVQLRSARQQAAHQGKRRCWTTGPATARNPPTGPGAAWRIRRARPAHRCGGARPSCRGSAVERRPGSGPSPFQAPAPGQGAAAQPRYQSRGGGAATVRPRKRPSRPEWPWQAQGPAAGDPASTRPARRPVRRAAPSRRPGRPAIPCSSGPAAGTGGYPRAPQRGPPRVCAGKAREAGRRHQEEPAAGTMAGRRASPAEDHGGTGNARKGSRRDAPPGSRSSPGSAPARRPGGPEFTQRRGVPGAEQLTASCGHAVSMACRAGALRMA